MLIAASVITTRMGKLKARWKLEGGIPPVPGQKVNTSTTTGSALADIPLTWKKLDFTIPPPGTIGDVVQGTPDYAGTFVVYDWETHRIIWQSDWGNRLVTPAGVCFADGFLYVADLEGANLFRIDADGDPGTLLKRISHPYLNDVHSLERTTGGLLTTCSGNDLIIELDMEGNAIWEWWGAEHGFDVSPSGNSRTSGRGKEHRDQYYHTRYQSTHLNCANVRDPGDDRLILAMIFHQGLLVEIDRSLPPEDQKPRVILEGLARPHGLEKIPGGWLLANSLAKELLLLDEDLAIATRIDYDGGWIQDCTRLPNGNILLNDVDNHVLVEFAGPPWKIDFQMNYDPEWRMGELVVVPQPHEQAFSAVGERQERLTSVRG
jgi:hypothetical protein